MNSNTVHKGVLSIGEMAKLNDLSVQAIRLYSKMGILKPKFISPESGYRYYDIKQSFIIDNIQFLQHIGFSLTEIKDYFDSDSIDQVQEIIEKNICSIQERKREIKMSEQAILNLQEQISNYYHYSKIKNIVLEELPATTIHTFSIKKTNFHTTEQSVFETYLREMKLYFKSKKISLSYFYNVGSLINKEDLENNSFVSSQLFIKGDSFSKKIVSSTELKRGLYASIIFEDFKEEPVLRDKLLQYIRENKMVIQGPLICEPILELPFFQNLERRSLVRLRVLVKKN